MKKLVIIPILHFCFVTTFSQKQFSSSLFSITAGPSFPVGQFANKDLVSEKSGLAGLGQALKFSYTIESDNPVSFLFELRGQRNPVKRKAVEKELNNTPFRDVSITVGPNPPPATFTTYDNWEVNKSTWWSASLSGGLVFTRPAFESKKIMFRAKALAGGIFVKSPKFEASSISEENAYTIKQTSESAFGFTYTIGTDFIFDCRGKTFFIAGIEYMGTNRINFDDVEITTFGRNGPAQELSTSFWESRSRRDGRQTLSAVNLLLGIGFRPGN